MIENEIQENATDEKKKDYNKVEIETLEIEYNENLYNINSDVEVISANDNLESKIPSNNADKPYECHICGKCFSRNSSLKCHIRLHVEGPESMLRNSFNNVSTINSNTNLNVNDNNKNDENCDNGAIVNSQLQDDASISKTASITNERISSTNLDESININEFANCKNQSTPLNGVPLKTEFINYEDIHAESYVCGRGYKCVMCDKYFSRKSSLVFHYKFHPNKKLSRFLQKPGINNSFTYNKRSKIDLHNHNEIKLENVSKAMTNHAPEVEMFKSNLGELNGAVSTESNDYQFYKESSKSTSHKNNDDGKQYKCYICDKYFARNSSLNWHIQFHKTHMFSKLKKQCSGLVGKTDEGTKYHHSTNKNCIKNDLSNDLIVDNSECGNNLHGATSYNKTFEKSSVLKTQNFYYKKSLSTVTNFYGSMHTVKKEVATSIQCETTFKKHNTYQYNPQNNSNESILENKIEFQNENMSKLYKCDVCDKSFCTLKGLKIHYSHHGSLFIQNENSINTDEEDVENKNESKFHKCDICDKLFYSLKGLKIHFSHHGTLFSQNENSINTTEAELKNENNTNTVQAESPNKNASESYKCDVCEKSFYSYRGLKIHFSRHGTSFNQNKNSSNTTETELKNENNADQLEPPNENASELYNCDVCEKSFYSYRGLKIHFSHHGTSFNQNENSSNTTKTELKNKNNADQSEQPNENASELYKCDVCDKSFYSYRGLKIHFSRHGTSFNQNENSSNTTKTELKNKNNADQSEQPNENASELYKCDVCDKSFYSYRGLKIHFSRHGTSFTQNENSTNTTETKLENKNDTDQAEPLNENKSELYECVVCDKSFYSLRGLKIHFSHHQTLKYGDITSNYGQNSLNDKSLEISDPEKNCHSSMLFKCKLCKKSFENRKGLSRHIGYHNTGHIPIVKSHTSSSKAMVDNFTQFKCDMCNKSFCLKSALKRHIISNHSQSINIKSETLLPFVKNDTCQELKNMSQKLKCSICFKSFNSIRGLHIHASSHKISRQNSNNSNQQHNGSRESQSIENQLNSSLSSKILKSIKNEYKCKFCSRSFSNFKGLSRHIGYHNTGHIPIVKSSSPNKVWTDNFIQLECDMCNRSFGLESALKRHITCNHSQGQNIIKKKTVVKEELSFMKTDICHQEFKNKSCMLKCNICFKSFSTVRGLHIHAASHKTLLNNSNNGSHHSQGKNIIKNVTVVKEELSFIKTDICHQEFKNNSCMLKCNICFKSFSTVRGLHIHAAYHKTSLNNSNNSNQQHNYSGEYQLNNSISSEIVDNNESKHKCKFCARLFSNLKGLTRHVAYHKISTNFSNNKSFQIEDINSLKCNACNRSFEHLRGLRIHIAYHRNSMKLQSKSPCYQCNLCEKSFLNAKDLKIHITQCKHFMDSSNEKKHVGESFKCKFCSRLFHKARALRTHVIRTHGPYHKKKYGNNLKKHSSNNVKYKFYACKLCGKSFRNINGLSTHKGHHSRIKSSLASNTDSNGQNKSSIAVTYDCGICDSSFTSSANLKQHIISHKETINENVSTNHANSSSSYHNLKRHASSDFSSQNTKMIGCLPENLVKYLCHECGKSFPNVTNLRIHTAHHEKSKKTVKLKNLNDTIGTDRNPYECVYCEKSFNAKEILLEHVKTHTDNHGKLNPENFSVGSNISIVTNNPSFIENHVIDNEQNEKKLYQCTKCELTSEDKYQMMLHSSCHLTEQFEDSKKHIQSGTYTMEHLYNDLAQKKNTSLQMVKQEKNESLKCEFCEKTFRWKSNLAVHVQRHITESRQRCESKG